MGPACQTLLSLTLTSLCHSSSLSPSPSHGERGRVRARRRRLGTAVAGARRAGAVRDEEAAARGGGDTRGASGAERAVVAARQGGCARGGRAVAARSEADAAWAGGGGRTREGSDARRDQTPTPRVPRLARPSLSGPGRRGSVCVREMTTQPPEREAHTDADKLTGQNRGEEATPTPTKLRRAATTGEEADATPTSSMAPAVDADQAAQGPAGTPPRPVGPRRSPIALQPLAPARPRWLPSHSQLQCVGGDVGAHEAAELHLGVGRARVLVTRHKAELSRGRQPGPPPAPSPRHETE